MTDLDPAAAAADAIMTLIYYEVIVNTRPSIDRITRLTGITRADLEAARLRLGKVSYKPINVHHPDYIPTVRRPSSKPAESRQTKPRPPGMKPPPRQRDWRDTGDGIELWCTGHTSHPAHWAREEDFIPRADRPHLRHTYCDEGRKSYQRSKRVSTRALEEISSAGFTLTLDADSNLVGVACKECGLPFTAGDHVEGAAVMRHIECGVSG